MNFKIMIIFTLLVFYTQSSIAQLETKDVKVAKKESRKKVTFQQIFCQFINNC